MIPPELPNDLPGGQNTTEIQQAIEALRTMFHLAALCGVVLGAAFFLFLYKQVSTIKRQNDELKAYVMDYNTNIVPKVDMTRTNLEAFAKSNPTLTPILHKYFSSNSSATRP